MYQRLVLVGNLGRDPETHYSSSGIPIANFSVATNHKWQDVDGQTQAETVWFRVAAYGKLAENCQQYLTKGQKVLVEGTLIADAQSGGPRIFTRKDGKSGTAFQVRALTVRFLNSKSERSNGSAQAAMDEPEQEPLFAEEPF